MWSNRTRMNTANAMAARKAAHQGQLVVDARCCVRVRAGPCVLLAATSLSVRVARLVRRRLDTKHFYPISVDASLPPRQLPVAAVSKGRRNLVL
jgi:hypothetical protein